jgi:hypothetical protein
MTSRARTTRNRAATAADATTADATTGAPAADAAAEDLRLARLHLRLGMVAAARAELEDLGHRGALGVEDLSALAEVRWRGGDLDAAAEAANQHLAAGGSDVVAIVVAAEAAAAAGQPAESRQLVDRAAAIDGPTLDALFAGLPRRAYWPTAAAAAGTSPGGTAGASASAPGPYAPAPVATASSGTEVPGTVPGPSDVLAATRGLWDAEPEASGSAKRGGPGQPASAGGPTWVEPARPKGHADPEVELETARDELVDAPDRGLLRLALVLRLDPTLAPDVLEAVRLRHEPAALVIRGDVQRLLGRHLEAEAEFAEAAEAIERDAIARARRGGHHAAREDS